MKPLFAVLTLLGSVGLLTAQEINPGIRLGAHFHDVRIDDERNFEYEGQIGFAAGFFVELELSDNFAIQPEIAALQRRFEFVDPTGITNQRIETSTTYVDIPVLAKIKFGAAGTEFYIQGGPQFGYAVGQTITLNGEELDVEFSDNEDYNRGEVSAVVGAGVSIFGFLVDARYNLGLTTFQDDNLVTSDSYNQGLTLALGFKF